MGGAIGLAIATIGLDPMTAGPRFTFDTVYLMGASRLFQSSWDSLHFLQGLISFEEEYRERKQKKSEKINARIHRVLPTWLDFKRVLPTYFRSSAIGTAIGAIPGTGEIFHLLSLV